MSESNTPESFMIRGQELLTRQNREAFIKSYLEENRGKLTKQKKVRYVILSSSGGIDVETEDITVARNALENDRRVLIITEKVDVYEGGKLSVLKTVLDEVDNVENLY